ncbi:MAG: aa3-type cytochrome c oxidase subunit IV [Pseudomonadota bacterium]
MSDETPPAMDYAEHERTYEGFLKLSKITSLAVGSILWALIMFAFGGGFGSFLGTVTVLAALAAATQGIMSSGEGWMSSGIVFVLAILFVLMSTL